MDPVKLTWNCLFNCNRQTDVSQSSCVDWKRSRERGELREREREENVDLSRHWINVIHSTFISSPADSADWQLTFNSICVSYWVSLWAASKSTFSSLLLSVCGTINFCLSIYHCQTGLCESDTMHWCPRIHAARGRRLLQRRRSRTTTRRRRRRRERERDNVSQVTLLCGVHYPFDGMREVRFASAEGKEKVKAPLR